MQIVRSDHGLTTIPHGGEGLSIVLLAMKDRKEKERKRQQPLEEPLLEQFLIDKEMEQSVDKGSKGVLNKPLLWALYLRKHDHRREGKALF